MKRIISILSICVFLFGSISMVASAEEKDEGYTYYDESNVTKEDDIRYDLIGPSPRWAYVSNATLSVSYDGTNACCYVYISKLSNCTKVTGTMILYKKSGSSYTKMAEWGNITSSGDYLSRYRESPVPRGYTYKLVFDGTAYGTTGSEPIYLSTESTF